MKECVIELKNVSFAYDENKTILEDISLKIYKGEYVSLIGHNGSGKSTLAKIMAYLNEPTNGEVYINNTLINEKNCDSCREIIGIVLQNPDNQFIGSTVEEDIAFGLENRNVETKKMHEIVDKFASLVGMKEYLKKEPGELSGGQKQRVAIAGILALGLKVIILDEATSMLDPECVKDIKDLIFKMKENDKDLTIISITHDLEEAYLSDRVIVLNDKKIYKDDEPDKVFTSLKEMQSIGLDFPFILKIKSELKNNGIEIPSNIKKIKDLGGYLCKLK